MTLSASLQGRTGEKLHSSLFTFRYPGRESLVTEQIITFRPELKELYVYDISLTTGALLYACRGGIGATKELYIVDMHNFIKSSSVISSLKDNFAKNFGETFNKNRYLLLRERFNATASFTRDSSQKNAHLYLLWAASAFKNKYRGRGYDANYSPLKIDYSGLLLASRQSREKNLLFRKEDFYSFSESLLHDGVFLYFHMPTEFGKYGAGFIWNEKKLHAYVSMINELDALGHKVCISGVFERRGKIFRDYRPLFPQLDSLVVPRFKVPELTLTSYDSEIYLFNF